MSPVYLAYFDESGNTGLDLKDPQQPVFVLGLLLVPATIWTSLENELQLADMCTYSARKIEEADVGLPVREHHQLGMKLLKPLVTDGEEALQEIIEWMNQQIKKRPGT